MPRFVQVLVLVALVVGVCGQNDVTNNDASTVSPQDIYALSDDDFKLWLSGRQPKAWEGGSSPSTTPSPTTTSASVFRTTTTTTTPNPLDFLTTSPDRPPVPSEDAKSWFEEESTERTTGPDRPPVSSEDAKSWFEEETTERTTGLDVLGEQFKPAGEDYAQWLERQMNRVQEVTFIPQTTLTGDQFPGAGGLVTRLTTIRNRIPTTTFAPPLAEVAPVSPSLPPPPPPPAVAPSTPAVRGPEDLQHWLRYQLQTSQRLTDQLLAQWAQGGSVVRSDGHQYTPSAVSYQTSALIHGHQGVSHSGHIHSPAPVQHTPVRRVFHPVGSFFYSQPQVPHYGSYVGNYQTPLVIKYH